MKILFLISVFTFSSRYLFAQISSNGDSSVVNDIHNTLREMYGKSDTTLYLITNKQLHKVASLGSNVAIEKTNNRISRIVIIPFTKNGEFAEEYLFGKNELIFVYQTFVYFKEVPSLTKAINFKGQRFWETRFYFNNGILKFQKTTGKKENQQSYTESDLLKVKAKLLSLRP